MSELLIGAALAPIVVVLAAGWIYSVAHLFVLVLYRLAVGTEGSEP